MGNIRFDPRKLLEIQMLALQKHLELINHPDAKDMEEKGGLLIQGNHYAASSKMLIGINPHESEEGEFHVSLLTENGPWEIAKETEKSVHRELPYWRNCAQFFHSDTHLEDWIKDATSTFVCPWPTENEEKLNKHSLWLARGIMWQYSREIVLKMFEHHCNPKTIIAVGDLVVETLEEFFECTAQLFHEETPNQQKPRYRVSVYQWRHSVMYQLHPHFSWVKDQDLDTLKECARWLSQQIQNAGRFIPQPPSGPPINPISGSTELDKLQGKISRLISMIRQVAGECPLLEEELRKLAGSSHEMLEPFRRGRKWEDSKFEQYKDKVDVEGEIFRPKLGREPGGAPDRTGSYLVIRLGPLPGPGRRCLELWREPNDWLIQFPTENDYGRYKAIKSNLNVALAFMAGAWSRAEERGSE